MTQADFCASRSAQPPADNQHEKIAQLVICVFLVRRHRHAGRVRWRCGTTRAASWRAPSQRRAQVVELIEVRDKDDGSSTWKPVVAFKASNGRPQSRFAASFSSKPAPIDVGEGVAGAVSRRTTRGARIKGFSSLWLGPTILGGLGAGLCRRSAAASCSATPRRRSARKHYLMAYGNAIETDLQGVERNTSLEVNGKNPWRITSQWLDPVANKLRVFHSENLWFDPTRFVTAQEGHRAAGSEQPEALPHGHFVPAGCRAMNHATMVRHGILRAQIRRAHEPDRIQDHPAAVQDRHLQSDSAKSPSR